MAIHGKIAYVSRSIIKLAVFENSKTVSESLRTILDLAGDCCCLGTWTSVNDAGDGLDWTQLDVVLMDLHSSQGNALPEIKKRAPRAQIIILTVYEDIDVLFDRLQKGACGYLLKRSRPEDILSAVREVHSGGALMSSAIGRKILSFLRKSPSGLRGGKLSDHEHEVVQLVSNGLGNEDIARRLNLEIYNVRRCVQQVYVRLHGTAAANFPEHAGGVQAFSQPSSRPVLDAKPLI